MQQLLTEGTRHSRINNDNHYHKEVKMENYQYQVKGAVGMCVTIVTTALVAAGFFDLGALFYIAERDTFYLMQIAMLLKFLLAGFVYMTWKNDA